MSYFSSFYFRAKYWASQFFRKPLTPPPETDFVYRPDFRSAPIQIIYADRIVNFEGNNLNDYLSNRIPNFRSEEIRIQTGKELLW